MNKIVLLILLFSFAIFSNNFIADSEETVIPLSGHYSVLFEKNSNWSSADFNDSSFLNKFKATDAKTPTFTVTRPTTIWAKSSLQFSGSSSSYFISTSAPYIDSFTIYSILNDEIYDSVTTTETGKLKHSVLYPALPITLNDGDKLTVFIKYIDEAPVPLIVSLKKDWKFYRDSSIVMLLNGLFYGIIIILLLYNAVLYYLIKEKTLLYYGAYLFANLLFQSSLDGTFQRVIITGSSSWFANRVLFGSVALLASSLMLTTQSLLKLDKFNPRLNKTLHVFSVLFFVEFVSIIIFPGMRFYVDIMAATFVLATITALASGLKRLFPFNLTALYFLLAIFPFMAGGVLIAMRFTGFIPASFLTENGVQIGTTIEVIFFSLALTIEIKKIQREREEAEVGHLKQTQQFTLLTDSLSRFIPKEFIKYLGNKSLVSVKLGDCVEKRMSVLFCDIRDFTSLSEDLTPEENFRFLNSFLMRMEPEVRSNNGFIDKYIGDGIMAIFENADDAVKAGLDMLKELKVYNKHRVNSGYREINIGIGINSSDLMLGIIGGENRMESTVISDGVNLASRIESLTKKYHTPLLISNSTFEELEEKHRYLTRFIDNVKVKGKSDKTLILEVFNSDENRLRIEKLKSSEQFENGLVLYFDEVYEQSVEIFEQIVEESPNDSVANLYLKRSRKKLKESSVIHWEKQLLAEA
jgi:class 3 adenylate cyclase